MLVEPEEDHEREKMAKMERWRGGVDACIEADLSCIEEAFEGVAITGVAQSGACSRMLSGRVGLPSDLIDISSLLEELQDTSFRCCHW